MRIVCGAIAAMVLVLVPPPQTARAATTCRGLSVFTAPASAIGLKTSGAVVRTAAQVDDPRLGRFCKVLGVIRPVDSRAPDITFQVNLPERWNSKALQIGGGGYDGALVDAEALRFPDPAIPTALRQGYVTFGSDGGHRTEPGAGPAAFALNPEALRNYGGEQLKKVHDVAMALIERRYGRPPRRTYFQGNSQGGHEGFIVIQRWPADYDGVVAIHPVYDFTALQTAGTLLGQILYGTPGAWLPPAKVARLTREVYRACDRLDGLKDGVIANTRACGETFQVASLRCPGGADAGPACLSDLQIRTLQAFDRELGLGVTLEGGIDRFARWPVFEGADLHRFGFGSTPAPAGGQGDAFLYMMGDQLVRYMVMGDPRFDPMTFDPRRNGGALRRLSRLIDASEADISAFERRGGKLLIVHGTVDMAVTPYNSVAYYQRLVERYGEARLHRFVRFYMAPGFGHGDGPFQMGWDSLGALDAWVEQGRAPGPQTMVDMGRAAGGRRMPLCEFPLWPRYNGQGDARRADSFTCVQ